MQTLLHNATLVLADRVIESGYVLIEGERIAAVGEGTLRTNGLDRYINVGGAFVMPGLIDLHCDAIEKLIAPRPNVLIDTPVALQEADWRLAGCGITTEFHALSFDDNEFGVRDADRVWKLVQSIRAETGNIVRHRIHARYEVTSARGLEIIEQIIATGAAQLISLMNHDPGQGQFTTEEAFRNYVKRTSFLTDPQVDALLEKKRGQTALIPARIERVTQLARAAGLPIATHDDDTPEKVARWPEMGVTLAEFPTKMDAAQAARDAGLVVCMGAPNVLRGISSSGNLSAMDAIRAGVADALCSDYYPSAMLHAAFKLVAQNVRTLPEAIAMVTLNPARAVHLEADFGSLETGKIADMIVVRADGTSVPRVQRVIVGGVERIAT